MPGRHRPTLSGANILLWAAPLLLIGLGGALSVVYIRRRALAPTEAALSPDEEARLKVLLKE